MESKIWVRMNGYLVGDKKLIDKLVAQSNGYDVEFSADDIKGLRFESSDEGYIPESEIALHKEM